MNTRIGDYVDAVEIGRGGFATVYRARQPEFGRDVAVKVVSESLGPRGVGYFEQECLAIGALSGHPNIVTVFDAGITDDGRPYIVMEYLPSGSLRDLLSREGRLDWPRVVAIGVKLGGALESAHRAGILHRDVKPENVLLSAFGEPKLADFGIAAIRGTNRSLAAATFSHVAPEVLSGGELTVAGDLYSLASTLHALLSGGSAFSGEGEENSPGLVHRVQVEPPPDLRSLGVPDRLAEVIEQGMEKEPTRRQADVAQLGRQLQAIEADTGGAITPLPLESDRPAGPVPRSTLPGGQRWARAAQVGALVLVLAAVVVSWPDRDQRSARLSQVFQDNFDVGQGWYEHDDDTTTMGYEAGHYRILVKEPQYQATSDTAFRGPVYGLPLTDLDDVSVEVSARSVSGTGLFGVVCRKAAPSEYYEGVIGGDGSARIIKRADGRFLTLTRNDGLPVPTGGFARLRLDCLGTTDDTRLTLFADGREVARATDHDAIDRGGAGLALASADASSAEVLFDDFVIFGRSDEET